MRLAALFAAFVLPFSAQAAMITQTVDYRQDQTPLKGYLVYDDAIQGPRPGVLVFPEWWGMTDYPKHRAEQLAGLGYVAFVADMYGSGTATDDPQQAMALSGAFRKDPQLMRQRAGAALQTLQKDPRVRADRIAAIGYCFGGTNALELARGGADLRGVVAFHAGLGTQNPSDARNIKGKILVCAGGADPHVPDKDLLAFMQDMRAANVAWQLNVYSGAMHAFTNPDADSKLPGIAYNAEADRRSWEAMKSFLSEVLNTGS